MTSLASSGHNRNAHANSMNAHAKAFFRLARMVKRMNEELADAKALSGVRDLMPGKYKGFTVYEVGSTIVKRHERRGFVAVRMHNKK